MPDGTEISLTKQERHILTDIANGQILYYTQIDRLEWSQLSQKGFIELDHFTNECELTDLGRKALQQSEMK